MSKKYMNQAGSLMKKICILLLSMFFILPIAAQDNFGDISQEDKNREEYFLLWDQYDACIDSESGARDYRESIALLKRMHEIYPGELMPLENLGICYTNLTVEDGGSSDFTEALEWLLKAEEQGSSNTTVYYCESYIYSFGKEMEKAVNAMDKAAYFGFYDFALINRDGFSEDFKNTPWWKKIEDRLEETYLVLNAYYEYYASNASRSPAERVDFYNGIVADLDVHTPALISIRINPFWTLADAFREQGNNSEAAALYSTIIEFTIHLFGKDIGVSPSLYNKRGLTYYAEGNYDEAVVDFSRAIEINPWDAVYYYNRGKSYYNKRDYADAAGDLERALQINPDKDAWYHELALSYFHAEDYDNAIEAYSIALEKKPGNDVLYSNRGDSYYNLNDYANAAKDYAVALEINPDNNSYYINLARTYYYLKDFDKAINIFSLVIERNPDDAGSYNERGSSLLAKKDYINAISDFNAALRLNPDHADAWNCLGISYDALKEYEKAIENYNRAIELKPGDAIYLYNRGRTYQNKKDHLRAIEDFSEAIKLDPLFERSWNSRGMAWHALKEYEKAIKDISRAVELKSDDALFYYNLGSTYSEMHKYDKAIEYLNISLTMDPDYVATYNWLGITYKSMGEYFTAIDYYSRAIKLNPKGAVYYSNRGSTRTSLGDYDGAIEDCTIAIELDPRYAQAYSNRALAYDEKGGYALALIDHGKAIGLEPDNARLYNDRAKTYRYLEEFDRGIEDCTKAIELDSNYASAYHERGFNYDAKGDYQNSIADYTRALEIEPEDPVYYNNRAGSYYELEDFQAAIEDYTMAIKYDPYHIAAYNTRGICYRRTGRDNEAIDDYRKCIEISASRGNINDVFLLTWMRVMNVYDSDPYLSEYTAILKDMLYKFYFELSSGYWEQYIRLCRDGIELSIDQAEKMRTALGSRGSDFMAQWLYFYYTGVDFQMVFGKPEKAFEYSESLRSRGFLEQISTGVALDIPGIAREDAEKVKVLDAQIDELQSIVRRYRNMRPEEGEENRLLSDTALRLREKVEELEALDNKIGEDFPQYRELRKPSPVDLEKAKAWCGPGRVVLEYVLWDNTIDYQFSNPNLYHFDYKTRPAINSYCLVLTKDGVKAERLAPAKGEENPSGFDYPGMVESLRSKIFHLNEEKQIELLPESAFEAERNALYNALIKPVLKHLPEGTNEIVIVPDGSLAYLPFDILRESENSSDFGQRYRLSLSPSVSVSELTSRTAAPAYESLLGFGDAWYKGGEYGMGDDNKPLPWADLTASAMELTAIMRHFSNPSILKGPDASEAKVKELSGRDELAKYAIIHFACHGFFNQRDPARSGLLLSEISGRLKNGQDGNLSIEEVVLLKLNAQMVLLAACSTGMGKVERGDGMVGLARSFMVAGAKNVGVSLWDIDEQATLDFMSRLYRYVKQEKQSFREAYYQARNHSRKEKDHPYYWAAFTMYE
jgi:tetratricopeptide (TPR) repeat protein/CHAT domain-containing protein